MKSHLEKELGIVILVMNMSMKNLRAIRTSTESQKTVQKIERQPEAVTVYIQMTPESV